MTHAFYDSHASLPVAMIFVPGLAGTTVLMSCGALAARRDAEPQHHLGAVAAEELAPDEVA